MRAWSCVMNTYCKGIWHQKHVICIGICNFIGIGIGICNFILHLPKASHSDLFLLPLCAYNNFGLPYCHPQHYRHLCHITHNHFFYIEDPGRCYPLTKRKLLESAAVSSYWETHRLYNWETYRLYNHSLLPLSFQKALELLQPSSTFCTLLDWIH